MEHSGPHGRDAHGLPMRIEAPSRWYSCLVSASAAIAAFGREKVLQLCGGGKGGAGCVSILDDKDKGVATKRHSSSAEVVWVAVDRDLPFLCLVTIAQEMGGPQLFG